MSEQSESDVILVVKQLYSTIKKVGYKKVLHTLSWLSNNPNEMPKENHIVDFIIFEVTRVYGCTLADLKKSNIFGELQNARKMCLILIKENTPLSSKEISAHFFPKPNHTVVSHAIKFKETLNPDFKRDQDFLNKYQKLTTSIQKKQKSITTKVTDNDSL